MSERNPLVLIQIQKIDEMFATSGVRDYCLDCIKGPEGGCCQRCDLLDKEGCTNKPLACALWLCGRAGNAFKEVRKELAVIAQNWPIDVAHGYRHRSLEAEKETL